MPFYELTMQLSHELVAAVDELLTASGAVGVTYLDAKDQPIYEPKPGEMPLWQQIKLIGLYDDEALMQQASQQLVKSYPSLQVQTTQLQDQVWERVWLTHFKPTQFGPNTWVIPAGYELVDPDATNLILDPGLAFGTGTHETTALCLRWLDAHDVTDQCLIDFGCGSGILAVMALLKGARAVKCVDIDDQAIEATLQNAEKNGVLSGIEIVSPETILDCQAQDGILANILAEPLMAFCDDFHRMLKPGGFIVLSGILKTQKNQLCDKYASRFIDIDTEIDQDWVRVSAAKAKSQQ